MRVKEKIMADVELDLPVLEVRDGVDRETIETVASMGAYKYGWATDIEMDYAPKGLSEDTVCFISAKKNTRTKMASKVKLSQLKQEDLILPTGPHGLRSTLDAAFSRAKLVPKVVLEIDSLALLMEAVDAGLGATLQPWAAVARFPDAAKRFHIARIADANVQRVNVLCSLSEDELSPVALAARVVLRDCAQQLVSQGVWTGARVKS